MYTKCFGKKLTHNTLPTLPPLVLIARPCTREHRGPLLPQSRHSGRRNFSNADLIARREECRHLGNHARATLLACPGSVGQTGAVDIASAGGFQAAVHAGGDGCEWDTVFLLHSCQQHGELLLAQVARGGFWHEKRPVLVRVVGCGACCWWWCCGVGVGKRVLPASPRSYVVQGC